MYQFKSIYLLVILLFFNSCFPNNSESIKIPSSKSLITYLASDSLEGRFPGTRGDSLAEVFIISNFERAGLTPIQKKWRQHFVACDTLPTANVIGFLKGSDSTLSHEVVIVGAHFDHLGWGGKNSSSCRPDTIAIHPGADDNASGVSTVISTAFKMAKICPKRSILFVCFSAEELGLIGSKFFVRNMDQLKLFNDTLPIHYRAMVNTDMVGHLENRPIVVEGVATALGLDSLLKRVACMDSLNIITRPNGYGASDNTSFYLKDIPVCYVHTVPTMHYHTPMDKANTLDYVGLDSVQNFIANVVEEIANDALPLFFKKAEGIISMSRSSMKFKVKLGLMPDVSGLSCDGLYADIVTKGKPAYKSGMRSRDIIISMNGARIHNIQDYMKQLMTYSKNDIVLVKVRRKDTNLQFQVHL